MYRASWNGAVIAESSDVVHLEGRVYFPMESLKREYLGENPNTSECYWKGTANYYDLVVDGKINDSAVWYYSDPSPAAESIRGRVAFWKGVNVSLVE